MVGEFLLMEGTPFFAKYRAAGAYEWLLGPKVIMRSVNVSMSWDLRIRNNLTF